MRRSVGAGDAAQARRYGNICTALGGALMGCTGLLMMIFCPFVFRLLTPVAEVRTLAAQALRIGLLAEPLFGVSIAAAGALRGAGDSLSPMIVTIASFVVFRQIYLYIVSHFITNTLLPLAMGYPAGWLVCSAATLLYYRRAALGRQRLVEDN